MKQRLLVAGVAVWLVGALTGEAMAFVGAGLALAGAVTPAWLREHWKGMALLTAYAALSVASAYLWAPTPLRSGAPWSALHWAFFPLAVLAIREFPPARRTLLFDVFAAVALLSAVVAIVQHFTPVFDQPWLRGFLTTRRVVERAEEGGFKAGGLHFHRLRFAHTLVPLLLAMLPAMWRSNRRWLGVVTAAVSLVALHFTYTRASWLALGAGVLVFALASWRRSGLVLLAALVPLATFFGASRPADRAFAWSNAASLFTAHPLLGTGYGGYSQAALALNGGQHAQWPLIHLDAHSLLLQFLAEQGLLGAVLWVAMTVVFLRFINDNHPPAPTQCAVIAALSVLGIVHNWAFHPAVALCAAWALAFTAQSLLETQQPPGSGRTTAVA